MTNFTKIKVMSGIGNYYQPVKDKIVFTDSGDIFNVALFFEEEKIGDKITGVCAHGNGTLFCNWDANIFWFDYINAPVLVHQGATFGSTSCSENEVIIAINGGESYCVYNISDRFISNKLEKITNVVFCLHFGRFVFTNQSNDSVYCNNKDTGALFWHFDVTEPGRYREWYPEGPEHPGEVRKFIGVWEGMLLVALSGYTIVALDVETGRVLHKWRDIPGFEPGWMPSAIPKPERMVLDAAGGKLVALWSRYFWEIDLRSGDIQMHDLSADFGTPRDLVQYLVQGGLNPALLGDKHLIAFAERYHSARDGSDAEIIAFNRQTRQIDWRHTFPLGAGVQFGVNDPAIAGNRLYALDISGTLHIFERTE